jgi:cytochrome oxidase Cu insertion factor (SCO1/SenC/PrrC family)
MVAIVLGVALLVMFRPSSSPSGKGAFSASLPPGITASGASLLQLSVLSPASRFRPPGFSLTDQYGRKVSLASFRGKAVALSFNDDRCSDLCTLLAQDIVVADHDLGVARRHVVFLSVNVNPFYPQVAAVRAWADEHGLSHTANWVSTTGPVPALRAVWKRYGVFVGLDRKTRTVVHSTEIFFIDPTGTESALGEFGVNAANTTSYGHDLAQVVDDLLPPSERVRVGGEPTPSPSSGGAAVGAMAPSLRAPWLGRPGALVNLASLRGRYVVLDFFSGSCAACAAQLSSVEAAARQLAGKAAFLGISTDGERGLALARRAGVGFPVAGDEGGRLSRSYEVHELPFAVIVGPKGHVVVRHPGSLTTEQLLYVLNSEIPLSSSR